MTPAQLRDEGARRFARWNPAAFDAATLGPAVTLGQALRGQPDADAVVSGYLRLVQQAAGVGVLRHTNEAAPNWSSFLERLLVEVIPAKLPDVPPSRRLPVLVEAWNLGEGLLREPAWVDRYVSACAGNLGRLDALEEFLVRTLGPVLAPVAPAAWAGNMRVTVLDLRAIHDEFLPGRLRLAAPTVLCVEDRRRAGLQIGVLLRRERKSEPLGVVSGLGEYAEPGKLPGVQFEDGKAKVAGKPIDIPTLRRCHAHVVARAGFIAACAADSQRLWIIESD